MGLDLARDLVLHPYALHVRELETLLWQRLASPDGAGDGRGAPALAAQPSSKGAPSAITLTPERVQRCLDENNGALEPTARALGMRNRFALPRLIKRHNLEVRRRPGRGPRRPG